MIKHLSVRVAWHDNQWNGAICKHPNSNGYCTQLPRVYEEKKDDEEANKAWWELKPTELPPCKAEGGGFMNSKEYVRSFEHPYVKYEKANHAHLARTEFQVPPYSAFAVPFWWMLLKNQIIIDSEFPDLPKNNKPKDVNTSWVYDDKRQHALLDIFFKPIVSSKSLVVFYTKSGNPIDEECKRLLIGIGTVTDKTDVLHYNKKTAGPDYPVWDRRITHSVRPDENNGFLIPYHQYLELADTQYKVNGVLKSKAELIDEIKVSLVETGESENRIDDFSYGSKWITNRNMLAVLIKLRHALETIINHGIVEGPWENRIQWINKQVGLIKENMGPFPSFSSALVALGFKHSHLFSSDIYDLGICKLKDNPWEIFEKAIRGEITELNNKRYGNEFKEIKTLWESLSQIDRSLLYLLSRFDLSAAQIIRWFDEGKRKKYGYGLNTTDILNNPYLIVEKDDPRKDETPIDVELIDNGVFEDASVQGEFVPEEPYRLDSKIDRRRVRAIIISVLKDAANQGDTLLSIYEIRERLSELNINDGVDIPANYIQTHIDFLKEELIHISTENVNALQLKIYDEIETALSQKIIARASRVLPSLGEDWNRRIIETVKKSGVIFDESNSRHMDALRDQSRALEIITTRKLSILNGPAGTGKTSVMGALVASDYLISKGILLLAPTGKARVKLEKMTGHKAFTIAQFLTKQGRFDWERMKTLFYGKETYKAEKTVIIDECSMLTEDDLYAIFQTLDLMHVDRIILVGDPYQLPPIGAGRPFADLCSYLDRSNNDQNEALARASGAIAKLSVVVRTTKGVDSDTLMLASWFAGRKGSKNSDQIFDKLKDNELLNDLQIIFWDDPDKLSEIIGNEINLEYDINENELIQGFDKVLGIQNNLFPIDKPGVVENFQLLSPVRSPVWGTNNINRFIQQQYRKRPTQPWEKTLGDQQIWKGDKIIQVKNEKREGFANNSKTELQLSNGQIGYMVSFKSMFGNAAFAGLEGYTFGYKSSDFKEDGSTLELAYAITIHKSQGSDFKKVFLILPKTGRILSRELMYTGLTRSKDKLVLLVEGVDASWLFNYSKAEVSETARRNTHLFKSNIRESKGEIPFVQNLIHKTKNGIFVRSKSEVIIANMLDDAGITFEYERKYETDSGWRLPDFSIPTRADDIIILEHLGMLHKPSYLEDWKQKLKFYEQNGFVLGENLFTTKEDENGAINSELINNEVIEKIKALI